FKAFDVYENTQLSNGGEEIELTEPRSGTPIFSLEYGVTAPWPEDADGFGYSIVSCEINPTGNPDDPSYWCLSNETGGSPGRDDSASVNENL
ncbi:MAG: hypothetical protein ACOCSE_06590, partial [Chitinivibrionales bacterium]